MRGIVKTDQFERDLLVVEPDVSRSDEFLDGVEWLLSRDPTVGTRLNDAIWSIDTSEYALITPLTLYYTFDDERVYFLALRRQTTLPDD